MSIMAQKASDIGAILAEGVAGVLSAPTIVGEGYQGCYISIDDERAVVSVTVYNEEGYTAITLEDGELTRQEEMFINGFGRKNVEEVNISE